MKKYFNQLLIVTMVLIWCTSGTVFADIDAYYYDEPSGWASDDIETLANYNVLDQSAFQNYKEEITRQEFIYLAVKLYEELTGKSSGLVDRDYFSDTDNFYARKGGYIGITSGIGDGKFGPNEKLTREQLATMMVNTLELTGIELTKSSQLFGDDLMISGYAKEAVYKAYKNKIIVGSNNLVNPKKEATVEQALLIFKNIYDQYDGFDNMVLDQNQLNALSSSVVKLKVDLNDGTSIIGHATCVDQNVFVTTFNVLSKAKTVTALYEDGTTETLDISFIGYDESTGMICFYSDGERNIEPLKIGNSMTVKTGQAIKVLNSPDAISPAVTSGAVNYADSDQIQITAVMNQSSNGAALMNIYGEVIGVMRVVKIKGENKGFAIPMNHFKIMEADMMTLEEFVSHAINIVESPKVIVTTNADKSLDINWNLVDADYYKLYESAEGQEYEEILNYHYNNEWYNDTGIGLKYIDPKIGLDLKYAIVAVKGDQLSYPAEGNTVKIQGVSLQKVENDIFATYQPLMLNNQLIQLSKVVVSRELIDGRSVIKVDLCVDEDYANLAIGINRDMDKALETVKNIVGTLTEKYDEFMMVQIVFDTTFEEINSNFIDSYNNDASYTYDKEAKLWNLYYPLVRVAPNGSMVHRAEALK